MFACGQGEHGHRARASKGRAPATGKGRPQAAEAHGRLLFRVRLSPHPFEVKFQTFSKVRAVVTVIVSHFSDKINPVVLLLSVNQIVTYLPSTSKPLTFAIFCATSPPRLKTITFPTLRSLTSFSFTNIFPRF